MIEWTYSPVLFLDIDGVLNSRRAWNSLPPSARICPTAVAHLQTIIDATDCTLVLSSTWRKIYSLIAMREKLAKCGLRHPIPLRSKTPDLDILRPGEIKQAMRGEEVQKWMEWHGYTGKYVCLDDADDFLPGQPVVRTTFEEGLTSREAERCIEILGRKAA